MHGTCHQVRLDRKSLNTKRLSPYARSKSVAESFRGWDWLFRFWDARCNTASQSESLAVFWRWIVTAERSGLLTRIATTESVSLCARVKS